MTDLSTSVSLVKLSFLFLEGLLSFLSPCVIPILPIYIGILAGKKEQNEHGELVFNKRNTITNTLSFVLGICSTFFILAFATSFISIFLNENIKTLQIVSGILIVFMGLLQLGIFKIGFLKQEFSIKDKVKRKGNKTTPVLAFLMGFTFSFSWTPCIGPILASVFLYASSHTGIMSIILVLVYCLGFILPFIFVAFFASTLLRIFKKHTNILKYTQIISGIILIIIGILILSGSFVSLMRYFN